MCIWAWPEAGLCEASVAKSAVIEWGRSRLTKSWRLRTPMFIFTSAHASERCERRAQTRTHICNSRYPQVSHLLFFSCFIPDMQFHVWRNWIQIKSTRLSVDTAERNWIKKIQLWCSSKCNLTALYRRENALLQRSGHSHTHTHTPTSHACSHPW